MYNLLVVDDEMMIREGIKKAIDWEKIGIKIILTAASGQEALHLLQQNEINIMITDINMSEMSGLQLIAQCRSQWPDLRIIVLSGYDDFEYARESLRLKVLDFLLKPIDETTLQETVKKQVAYLDELKDKTKKEIYLHRTLGTAAQLNLEQILIKLLHGNTITSEEQQMLTAHYYFNFKESLQVVVLLSPAIDRNISQEYLQGNKVLNICIEQVDVKELGLALMETDRKIILILQIERLEKPIEALIEKIKSMLKQQAIPIPQVCIGSKSEGLADLHISYNDALLPLDSKKEELRKALQMKRSAFSQGQYADIFINIKQMLIDATPNGDKVMHVFELFAQSLSLFNISENNTKRYCFELISDAFFSYFNSTSCALPKGKLSKLMELLRTTGKNDTIAISKGYLTCLYAKEEQLSAQWDEAIRKAIDYIQINLNKDLSVSQLAEMQHYTPNYFSRLFKKETGQGCNEYIVSKRIEKAKELLLNTNFPTGKIAELVGYRDINYFSIAFKKYCGAAPTSYRKRARKG
ncbi:MAG: response regulator [Spirochaetia bacterium]|jgi:two-component system response regulator YesN|nr:response regulator [Spirochaetia bacterium]